MRNVLARGLQLGEDSAVPDLAPHIDSSLEFGFIEDGQRKQYFKSLFTDSFYEPNCDGKSKPEIKPIYFWPGQRVDLRCVMCRRAFTYNGLMKHWWFMPAKDIESALENMQDLKNAPSWERDLLMRSSDYIVNKWGYYGAMPSSSESGSHPRVHATFIQRRGMLIILQPTSENEGFYRCLDNASRNVIHFLYYLIAMQPIFIYLNPSGEEQIHQIESECPKSKGFPDSNWKFRHIPPTYIRDAFEMCDMEWSACLDWLMSDDFVREEKSWNLHGRTQHAEMAKKFINLKIQLQWSEWSSCERGSSVRTREGHCYLRKIDQKKDVGQLLEGVFSSYDLFNWVSKLKNHMSKIPEFNTTGIRLYSGLISKLIHEGAYGDGKSYDDCYTMDDSFFAQPKAAERWLSAIFTAFGVDSRKSILKKSDRLCLYYYAKPTIRKEEIPSKVLVGTHIIDTQRCPTK